LSGLSVALDPDAAAYIAAVEAADGQPLEAGVRAAINAFVVGCKSDASPFSGVSNFEAIKASCVMMGARTLAGALVPLRGVAPTNFNFVAGDYNRVTGLKGNGTNKYLNSNRANNADPQNSNHNALFVGESLSSDRIDMGSHGGVLEGTNYIVRPPNNSLSIRNRSANLSFPGFANPTNSTGLMGVSRSQSGSFSARLFGSSDSTSMESQNPEPSPVFVMARLSFGNFSSARVSYYSIGEAADLAALDARITALRNAIATALA
jgi:hypothetical protein